jgi:hypothetical protein
MPARRHLQVITTVGVTALSPLIMPNHIALTLIGRGTAIEMTERLDRRTRDLGIENLQKHQAQAA